MRTFFATRLLTTTTLFALAACGARTLLREPTDAATPPPADVPARPDAPLPPPFDVPQPPPADVPLPPLDVPLLDAPPPPPDVPRVDVPLPRDAPPTCPPGSVICLAPPRCVDIANDPRNCGGCGAACPMPPPNSNPRCTMGTCTTVCFPFMGDCDGNAANGCESSLSSTANCGRCGNACAPGQSCTGGTCTGGTVGYSRYLVAPVMEPFVDACAAPGHLTLLTGIDDSTTAVMMPFAFTFFRTRTAAPWVSSNGIVGFGTTPSSAWASNCTPSTAGVNDPALFAFWDDLVTRTAGVCVATVGTAPSRRFVVTWSDAQFCCGPMPDTHLTFSAVLYEGSDALDVIFQTLDAPPGDAGFGGDISRATGGRALIAVQNTGSTAMTTYACQRPFAVASGLALRYTPVP